MTVSTNKELCTNYEFIASWLQIHTPMPALRVELGSVCQPESC